jgi:CBS domain-containing protein
MSAGVGRQRSDNLLDDKAAGARIHTIMGTGLATVEQHDSLRDVAKQLRANDIGAVLVRSPGGPIGIVSERDIVSAAAMGLDLEVEQVNNAMSVDLVTAPATASIAAVGRLMVESGVRHVIVRDGSRAIGLVSIRDVLDALLA